MKNKFNRDIYKVLLYSEAPLSYYGGGERLIVMIWKHLKKSIKNISVLQNDIQETDRRIDPLIIKEWMGSDLRTIKFHRYGKFKFLYQDMPSLENISNEPNVCSIIFSRRIPPKNILRKLKKKHTKIIFALHGIALENFRITSIFIMVHQIVIRKQLKVLARFLDGNIYVQTLTPNISKFLTNAGANKDNIYEIENEFESNVKEIQNNDKEFKVLFISRMDKHAKGIVLLKRVIKRISKIQPNIKFTIIGSGKAQALLKNISPNVDVLGNASEDQKRIALLESNLAIITSNLEPFSLVALECLSSGLQIVTTPASGPSYIVGKNSLYGKVSSFRVRKFSKDLIEFYDNWQNDPEKFFEIRSKVAKTAREMFNESHMLEAYKRMVLDVLSK